MTLSSACKVLGLLCVIIACCSTHGARAVSVSGVLVSDAYVKEELPNNNFGASTTLLSGLFPAKNGVHRPFRALLEFDLGIVPRFVEVSTATLRLHSTGTYDSGAQGAQRELIVSRLSSPFVEGNNSSFGVTWATQPSALGSPAGPFVVDVGADEWLELEIGSLVQASLSEGKQFLSIRVAGADESEDLFKVFTFRSREWADPGLMPQLIVDYTDVIPPSAVPSHLLFVDAPTGPDVTIRGAVGSAEPGATVQVTNLVTNQVVSVVVGALGDFSVDIEANSGDTLSIVLTDASGNQGPSSSMVVPVTVAPFILAPEQGASIVGNRVLVLGVAGGVSGVAVNGEAALYDSPSGIFAVPNLLLADGMNEIVATAVDQQGHSASVSLTVSSDGATPAVTVDAVEPTGMVPFAAQFEYSTAPGSSAVSVAVDFDGDGTDDYQTTVLDGLLSNSYLTEGIHIVRVTMTDSAGDETEAFTAVQAFSAATVMSRVSGLWGELNAALAGGDIPGALRLLTPRAQQKYQSVFTTLAPSLASIVGSYTPAQPHLIGAQYSEIAVTRSVNGQSRVFLIGLVAGPDGVWRVDSM